MINYTAPDTTDEVAEALHEEQFEDIKKKSVSGAVSFFIRTAILQGVGLVAAFVLSAYLGPEDFAVYGFVTQIIGILVFFSDIGLAASLIQMKTEPTLQDYRTAFTIQQLLSWLIVGIVAVLVMTGYVESAVGTAGVWVIVSLALSFPLAAFKTISSIILERKLEFSKMVMPQIVEQLLFNVLLIWLATRGYGVIAYAYAITVRSVAGTVVMWYLQPWSMGLAINRDSLSSLFKFGAKFQLNDLLARIKDQLFFVVLLRFVSKSEFGYIQWSKNWSLYPYNLTVQNVMAITFPTFSRLQGHKSALTKAIEKSLFFISLGIFPILVGMCVFIIPLVTVVEKYHKWEPAVFSFICFTLSIGWAAISTPLTNTLNAIGNINTTLKLMVMWTVLTWVLTPALMYLFGYNGVALASLVISFTSVLPIYYVRQIVPVNIWDSTWRQLLAATAMGGVGVLGLPVWKLSLSAMFMGMILTSLTYGVVLLVVAKDKLWAEVRSLKS